MFGIFQPCCGRFFRSPINSAGNTVERAISSDKSQNSSPSNKPTFSLAELVDNNPMHSRAELAKSENVIKKLITNGHPGGIEGEELFQCVFGKERNRATSKPISQEQERKILPGNQISTKVKEAPSKPEDTSFQTVQLKRLRALYLD